MLQKYLNLIYTRRQQGESQQVHNDTEVAASWWSQNEAWKTRVDGEEAKK